MGLYGWGLQKSSIKLWALKNVSKQPTLSNYNQVINYSSLLFYIYFEEDLYHLKDHIEIYLDKIDKYPIQVQNIIEEKIKKSFDNYTEEYGNPLQTNIKEILLTHKIEQACSTYLNAAEELISTIVSGFASCEKEKEVETTLSKKVIHEIKTLGKVEPYRPRAEEITLLVKTNFPKDFVKKIEEVLNEVLEGWKEASVENYMICQLLDSNNIKFKIKVVVKKQ